MFSGSVKLGRLATTCSRKQRVIFNLCAPLRRAGFRNDDPNILVKGFFEPAPCELDAIFTGAVGSARCRLGASLRGQTERCNCLIPIQAALHRLLNKLASHKADLRPEFVIHKTVFPSLRDRHNADRLPD